MGRLSAKQPLIVENLSIRFGNRAILKEVSLKISLGEIIVIHGDSGSGKTTLLRCITLLQRPDCMTVSQGGETFLKINGEFGFPDQDRLSDFRRLFGFVFQDRALWPHYSASKNVALALQCVNGLAQDEASKRAHSALRRVGLRSDRYEARPHLLSGGEQTRVAIARTLVSSPEIILLDEPTVGLDSCAKEAIGEVISELANEGLGVLLVSHDRISTINPSSVLRLNMCSLSSN